MSRTLTGKLVPVDITADENQAVTSTYFSESNALDVKPLLDGLMAKPRSVFYSAIAAGCTGRTLQQKFLYGMRWLMAYAPNKEEYKAFRKRITIKALANGVEIRYIPAVSPLAQALSQNEIAVVDTARSVSWLDTFQNWLLNSKELDVFDSVVVFGGKLKLTEEDEHSLIKVCAPLGCELDINKETGTFKVMR